MTAQAELPQKHAPITNIEITGIKDTDKLMELLGLKKGDIYTPETARKAKETIIKAMEARGLYGTTVDIKVEPVNDSVALTFDVNKGEEIKITSVKFVGNEKVDASDLEENLVNKEGNWLSWVPFIGDGGGKAMPEQLPYDQMRIREAYLQRGYLDAKVSEPLMKVDFSKYEAEVTYVVHEGEAYTVSEVRIAGDVPDFDPSAVTEELALRSGKVFNVKQLRKDLKFLQEKVGDKGYAFARVEPVFKKDEKNHTVSVTYKIDPSKKVTIHDVIITGNTKTLDYVIRRYIYLAPGDLFSYTDLQDTKKELQRTGFFEKVVVKPQRLSEDSIDIVVEVEEAQTGSISGGITLFSLSMGIYDSRNEYDYDDTEDYTVGRRGGWISVGRKIGRHMHASIGYSYSDVDYSDYTPPAGVDPRVYESYRKSSLIGSFTFDNTDDYYVPREGIFSKLSLEYAGAGGDADFWKAEWKFAAYYGMEDMIDYDLIWRYKLRAGYISDGGYTPVAEMFTLGGARKGVRGYASGSVSPKYTDAATGNEYIAGGDQKIVNSIEASIPLDVITKNMRLTGFVDYGMIKNTIYDNVNQKGWVKRASAGGQIEWKSPFGPINLVFAYPIDDKPGDDTAVFEFTMGSKF